MRHAKPKERGKGPRNLAVGGALTLGVTAVPIAGGMAQAATISDWDKVAECESSGLWNRPDGDGGRSSGGLQFQPASWNAALAELRRQGVDTSAYPQGSGHQAYKATKQQQIMAGEALLALQGPGAWTCNARVGSPLQSSGPHGSMFKGGINPYAGAPSTPPPPPAPQPPATAPKPSGGTGGPAATPAVPQTRHTVVSGDTLFRLSRIYLGDGEKWPTMYETNKAVIGENPHTIFPGQVLKVGRATYTVAPGDTLFLIAKAQLGDGNRWHELYEANKALVGSDPHMVFPGQVLTLPDGAPAAAAPARLTVDRPSAPAPAPAPAAPAPTRKVVVPVEGRFSQAFGNVRASYSLGYHTGIDFSAPSGTPVVAATAGTVVASDTSSSYGINVQIRHADGKHTLYAHLSSEIVSVGQTVTAGQRIGAVGSTGNSSGPHLHFELRLKPVFAAGNFLDPAAWLRSNGVAI